MFVPRVRQPRAQHRGNRTPRLGLHVGLSGMLARLVTRVGSHHRPPSSNRLPLRFGSARKQSISPQTKPVGGMMQLTAAIKIQLRGMGRVDMGPVHREKGWEGTHLAAEQIDQILEDTKCTDSDGNYISIETRLAYWLIDTINAALKKDE